MMAQGAQLANLQTNIFPLNWYISGSTFNSQTNTLQQIKKEVFKHRRVKTNQQNSVHR